MLYEVITSLTIEDINLLKGEFTFSMNSIYKLYDKTDWRPTYYCIYDDIVFKNNEADIRSQQFDCAFYPYKKINWETPFSHPIPIVDHLCVNAFERSVVPARFRKIKFGVDIASRAYAGTSVVV